MWLIDNDGPNAAGLKYYLFFTEYNKLLAQKCLAWKGKLLTGKCMYETSSNVYLANFVFIIKPSGVSGKII